jgi:hypothetical protein
MVWWSTSITDVLNMWNQMGVFSYVIPFLLIFAVVFAILEKSKVLGENRAVAAIISLAIGLLALQFDFVPTFFATIFPRFGVGIAVLLVVVLSLGLFVPEAKSMSWIGYTVGIGVVIWAIAAWNFWGDNFMLGDFLGENFWALIILGLVIFAVVMIARKPKA